MVEILIHPRQVWQVLLGKSLLCRQCVAHLGLDIDHADERNLIALLHSIGTPVPIPVAPASRFAAFGDERTVHHRQDSMRRLNGLLNQRAIQLDKIDFLLKLSTVGTLVQRAVATQIGEVDFAHHNQNR